MGMTKRAVKASLGFDKDIELARWLGVSKQAISRIGDDDELPEGRQWQAMAKRPDLFGNITPRPREQGIGRNG